MNNNFYIKIKRKITQRHMSVRHQIALCKRICFLIQAGFSLPDAFTLMSEQFTSNKIILKKVSDQITKGTSLYTALFETNVFDVTLIALIKVGEESGTVAETFSLISDELQKRYELRNKAITALLYPACIFLGMIILLVMLLVVVFPKLTTVFSSLHIKLPITTRLLLFVSFVLQKWGIELLFFTIAFVGLVYFLYKTKKSFREKIQYITLNIPVFGQIVKLKILIYFCRTITMLLSNNIDIIAALRIIEDSCSNTIYKKAFKRSVQLVSQGLTVSESLQEYPRLFSKECTHMIEIGDASGSLEKTFLQMQQLYEHDMEHVTKIISSSVEPILMIVLGIAVSVIAVSIVGPMYQITQSLHAK